MHTQVFILLPEHPGHLNMAAQAMANAMSVSRRSEEQIRQRTSHYFAVIIQFPSFDATLHVQILDLLLAGEHHDSRYAGTQASFLPSMNIVNANTTTRVQGIQCSTPRRFDTLIVPSL